MDALDHKPHGSKAKVSKDHVVNNLVKAVCERSTKLDEMRADADGAMREEIAAMRGANVFTHFYSALKETREYHARNGERLQARVVAMSASAPAVEDDVAEETAEVVRLARDGLPATLARLADVEVEFSGEELWGKYLDLSPFHLAWCQRVT